MPTLYYVGDPMCSWCWGFAQVLEDVLEMLPSGVNLHYVMGGLAPDSDEPMPTDVRKYVQDNWREVAKTTNATFNWDFWELCRPRRSTSPACRAVIAAGLQEEKHIPGMFEAIQRAYYRQARNPSDPATLTELADEIGLDAKRFVDDLDSEGVEQTLQEGFALRRSLEADRFPSLILQTGDSIHHWLTLGYSDESTVVARLNEAEQR